MHRIDGAGHDNNLFTEGDPSQAIAATRVTDDWLNDVQENIMHLIEQAGTGSAKGQNEDLYNAIQSFLGGMPAGYINGLTFTKGADADHDLMLAPGACRDAADTLDLTLAAALTKQIDADWAEGDDEGGFFPAGGVQANTEYYLVLIQKDADGTLDWGFDSSPVGGNKPAGWTFRKRLGTRFTDSSSNIRQMLQIGRVCYYEIPVEDVDDSSQSSAIKTRTMSVPSNGNAIGFFDIRTTGPETTTDLTICLPGQTEGLRIAVDADSPGQMLATFFQQMCIGAQFDTKSSVSLTSCLIRTLGFIDEI